MLKDLNQALNSAKTRRGVFSKTIIWESGVSKSQFYRIIKGQEAPSAETKARISESLGLKVDEFDDLFKASKIDSKPASESKPKSTKFLYLILGFVAVFLCVVLFVLVSLTRDQPDPLQVSVIQSGDKTLFIADVTIPDGTSIPVNTDFVKIWRVQNVGNVVWKNRYLKRITPTSDLLCSSPAMVPIPETKPGEIIDISVTFRTPHLPGSCRTDWKTSDEQGRLYFPEMHGLFSIVTVVEN